jgi:hypothetical protein
LVEKIEEKEIHRLSCFVLILRNFPFYFLEDDEKKLIEDYRQKFTQKCNDFLLEQFQGFEDNENYIAVFEELNRKKRPDILYFESLGKKKCLRDFDLDGRRVLLKIHLKLGETKEAIEKKEGIFY